MGYVDRLTPILNTKALQKLYSVNDTLYDNEPVQTSVRNNPTATYRVSNYEPQPTIRGSMVDVDDNDVINANDDVNTDEDIPEDEICNKYLNNISASQECYTQNFLFWKDTECL